MELGKIIKERRKELLLTQTDLAEMSQVSVATIKNIETGHGNPSYSTIMKITDLLGLEIIFRIRKPF